MRKGRSTRNEAVLRDFIAALQVVPFQDADLSDGGAWRYGEVRAALEATGEPIGALDTLIAGRALSLGLALVTHNTREFERVKGLELQNWFPHSEPQP